MNKLILNYDFRVPSKREAFLNGENVTNDTLSVTFSPNGAFIVLIKGANKEGLITDVVQLDEIELNK